MPLISVLPCRLGTGLARLQSVARVSLGTARWLTIRSKKSLSAAGLFGPLSPQAGKVCQVRPPEVASRSLLLRRGDAGISDPYSATETQRSHRACRQWLGQTD
jgi:hypothetical protein